MHELDFTSPAYHKDQFPTHRKLREAGSVVPTKLPIVGRITMATDYAAVSELLRDHKRFVRQAQNAGKLKYFDFQWLLTRLMPSVAENMLSKDEPDHRRLRGLVEEAFVRRSVKDMRDQICELADETLQQTIRETNQAGVIDFSHFSRHLPLAVICELLGLPRADRGKFIQWAGGLNNVTSLGGMAKVFPNLYRINRYFRSEIRRCRDQPRDGLLSLLVNVEQSGERLSFRELTAMSFLLLFAGHETTTHLITVGLLTLLDHSEAREALRADWSRSGLAVDEVMRFGSPIQMTKPRIAAEDMEFHGVKLKRGQYLIANLASANSDPSVFNDPEVFDISRSPNPHLGFGTGIHVCLGLKLARLETQVALEHVLTQYPALQLAVGRDELDWLSRIGVHGVHRLPIRIK